jgi:hypothetical protein
MTAVAQKMAVAAEASDLARPLVLSLGMEARNVSRHGPTNTQIQQT